MVPSAMWVVEVRCYPRRKMIRPTGAQWDPPCATHQDRLEGLRSESESGVTAWRRLHDWQKAGAGDALYIQRSREKLDAAVGTVTCRRTLRRSSSLAGALSDAVGSLS